MEDNTLSSDPSSVQAAAEQKASEKAALNQKYKAKGAQNMTLKEYVELKKKKSLVPKPKLPTPVKIFLATPFIIISCFGILYIPYVVFQVAVGKPVPIVEKKEEKKGLSYQDQRKKTAEKK